MHETGRLRDLIGRHAGDGLTSTVLPGVWLLRATAVTEPLGEVAEPAVAVIAQGVKETALNGRVFRHGEGQFAVVPVELPVIGKITQASPDAPLLAVVLMLRQEAIAALLAETAAATPPRARAAVPAGIAVSDASPALLNAIARLLGLLDEPGAAAVLAADVEREIMWRLLTGPQGATVRQIGLADSRLAHLARAIAFIRAHYDQTLRIEDLDPCEVDEDCADNERCVDDACHRECGEDQPCFGDRRQCDLEKAFALFPELLKTSDIITLHVPLDKSTHNLIGERELAMMKPTAILINTCRGPVVDEKALYMALRDEKILGAGLDVMEAVHRGLGLNSFMRPHAVERVARDLATYLRRLDAHVLQVRAAKEVGQRSGQVGLQRHGAAGHLDALNDQRIVQLQASGPPRPQVGKAALAQFRTRGERLPRIEQPPDQRRVGPFLRRDQAHGPSPPAFVQQHDRPRRGRSAAGRHAPSRSCKAYTSGSPSRKRSSAETAARAALIVVMQGTPWLTAAARMRPSSVRAPLPLGVLTIKAIRPLARWSSRFGRPSWILRTGSKAMPPGTILGTRPGL